MKAVFITVGFILTFGVSIITFSDSYVEFSLEKISESEGAWPSEELEEEKWEDPDAYAARSLPYLEKRLFCAKFSKLFGHEVLTRSILVEAFERYEETPLEDSDPYMRMKFLEAVDMDDRNQVKAAKKLVDALIERYPEHPQMKEIKERQARLRLRTNL